MATKINYTAKDNIGFITFYEEIERKPCTLDWEVLKELDECINNIMSNIETYKAIVIQSSSKKSFIVGANIEVLKTLNSENISYWVKNGHRIFNRFAELPIPVIAKIESYALGGGLEIAMASDIIIASEEARFGQPEASLGVMPGWGGTYRLPKLIGVNRAKEMFMTGKIIDARLAYDWGLVNHICNKGEIDTFTEELIDEVSKNDSKVIAYVKEILSNEDKQKMLENCMIESITSANCMSSKSTIKRLNNFFKARKK